MLEKIQKIIREHKGDESLQISETTTFSELQLDSLDIVELIMSLEDEFDTEIKTDESLKTVGDLIKSIEV